MGRLKRLLAELDELLKSQLESAADRNELTSSITKFQYLGSNIESLVKQLESKNERWLEWIANLDDDKKVSELKAHEETTADPNSFINAKQAGYECVNSIQLKIKELNIALEQNVINRQSHITEQKCSTQH